MFWWHRMFWTLSTGYYEHYLPDIMNIIYRILWTLSTECSKHYLPDVLNIVCKMYLCTWGSMYLCTGRFHVPETGRFHVPVYWKVWCTCDWKVPCTCVLEGSMYLWLEGSMYLCPGRFHVPVYWKVPCTPELCYVVSVPPVMIEIPKDVQIIFSTFHCTFVVYLLPTIKCTLSTLHCLKLEKKIFLAFPIRRCVISIYSVYSIISSRSWIIYIYLNNTKKL